MGTELHGQIFTYSQTICIQVDVDHEKWELELALSYHIYKVTFNSFNKVLPVVISFEK